MNGEGLIGGKKKRKKEELDWIGLDWNDELKVKEGKKGGLL